MAIKTNTTIKSKAGKEYKYARVTKTIGHNLDGTPIKKQFVGRTKSEAEAKAEEHINSIKNGAPLDYYLITVGMKLDYWLYTVKRMEIRASSFDRYECTYRIHIKDSELCTLQLYSITSVPIQKYYNQLFENSVTINTIKEINKVLKMFFNWCFDEGLIKKNPVMGKQLKLPNTSEELESEEVQIFTDEQIKLITKTATEIDKFQYDIDFIVLLALGSGLREGEILGLENQYLDIENSKVYVRKTLKKVKVYESKEKWIWERKLQKPKSNSSVRTVDLPQSLVDTLKKHKYSLKSKYENNNLEFKKDSLLFVTKACQSVDARNMIRAWERFLERAGLEYVKFHALRHTYASILFKNGANILEVSKLLGHADTKMAEKIYIHIYPESRKETVNKIDYIFN